MTAFDHFSLDLGPNGYACSWPGLPQDIVIQFDRLRMDRSGQLGAEVTAYIGDRRLHSAWAIITTTDGRSKLTGRLEKAEPEASWQEMVEAGCVAVRNHFRLGNPAILMSDVPDVDTGATQLRDAQTGDTILPANELTIAFGDGDTGKSMVALLFASIIHAGRSDLAGFEVPGEPVRVAYADWETSAATQKARLRRMFGEFYPKDLVYIPGAGLSLPDSVDRFQRIIREHRIGYLIVDSIAYSCGGPPEDAAVAANYLNALQRLGLGKSLGVLAIAHVTKADAKGVTDKPFGSGFWSNSPRMTWYLRRNEGSGERYSVGMFNKKHNLGPRARPVGLTLDFSDDALVFGRTDAIGDAALAVGERLSVRIHRALVNARQPMTYAEIAEAVNSEPKIVAETCRRGMGTMFSKVPNEGREVRIGPLIQEVKAS